MARQARGLGICARAIALLAAVLLLAAPGCAEADPEAPISIVATTGMVADAARAVAGDRASVSSLMGSGVDPHLYKPTRADIARMMNAEVVFYNGLLLEGKMTDALVRAATSGRRVHAVSELIDESTLLEPAEFQGHYDPHIWMDPSTWSSAVEVVRDKLIEFDPAGEEVYRANARAYLDELAALDAYAQRVLATVPDRTRVLVTAHDAFNYFGVRYNFLVVGIQGISTESEAGVRDIQRLVDLLVERKIGAVFIESTVSRRNVESLIAGARASGQDVEIGGELFSDAMGAPGTYEGTYLGMIDHNVTTIARALGGQAPAGGRLGRLAGGEGP